MQAADLYVAPNALARHYSRFRVSERLLLTGHSHQAWPDVAFDAQQHAWLDAAQVVDDKWERAFARAERVKRGFARLLGEADAEIALGQNTHELVARLLSALPLRERRKLVTSTGEFHTVRRQLDRLAEEGLEIVKVDAAPADTLAERLAEAVDDGTAACLVSSVLFTNARIVPGLSVLAEACARVGAALVIDAYHHLNVVPFDVAAMGLRDAFVVGGGYKYCQLGEGNCFLRMPAWAAELRPVLTGWFAEFGALADSGRQGAVVYGRGAERFAGATYDPTSHYRAAAVFDFFDGRGLTPQLLREVSQHQVRLLAERFDALDLPPEAVDRDRSVPLEEVAGFLALQAPRAAELVGALRQRGVHADQRAGVLRLGPAPYLADDGLRDAMAALAAAVRGVE